MKKQSLIRDFLKGILKENPVFVLMLGTCPMLAVTTSGQSALEMGIAATAVLIYSNMAISALRKVIPDSVRIPSYITIIASFVIIVQMLVKAYFPEIDSRLGIYLPLITVNCIILGRAEMFASKNRIAASFLDGLGMGAGFTLALLAMGLIREFFGAGKLFGISVTDTLFDPVLIFILPTGGFFVFGLLIAITRKIQLKKNIEPRQTPCDSCGLCKKDGKSNIGESGYCVK